MRSRRQRAEKLVKQQLDKTPLVFIGGLFVESEGSATIPIVNPANGATIGRCPAANVRDVERAVDDAWTSSPGWSSIAPGERAALLWQLADLIEQNAEDLAILEALQTGRTFRDVLAGDVGGAIAVLRYFAGWAGKRPGETHDLGQGLLGFTHWEPHRVVGVITPWSAPFATTVRKIAPALAVGATVVTKPPEQAPLTVLRLAELMVDAGFPGGALNVLTGFGGQAGEAIAMSQKISHLAFSGSIETARRLLVSSAKSNLKDVDFDLGGKCAHVVFHDADKRPVVQAITRAIFSARATENVAGSRVLVHESIYEELSTTIASRAREIVVGDPLDEHTELGPMINEEHMKRVLAYSELGRREGAKLVAGGKRDVEGTKSNGFFVQPTVFVDVKGSMRIAKEEVGGPVLTILPFRSEDEAVELANGTDYGLAGAIWTQDIARAHRVSRKLRAGVVWINQYGSLDPALPFGGSDLSGHGRDLGRAALDHYSRTKAIYLPSR